MKGAGEGAPYSATGLITSQDAGFIIDVHANRLFVGVTINNSFAKTYHSVPGLSLP